MADIVGGVDSRGEGDGCAPAGLVQGPVVAPLEVVPLAMIVTDATGRALTTNARWSHLTGMTGPESLGSGWLSTLRPDDRSLLGAAVERVAAGGGGRRVTSGWGEQGDRQAIWWLAGHERAGQRLVGIAMTETGAGTPRRDGALHDGALHDGALHDGARRDCALHDGARSDGALAGEWRGMLESLAALLDVLDQLTDRLAGRQPVPA